MSKREKVDQSGNSNMYQAPWTEVLDRFFQEFKSKNDESRERAIQQLERYVTLQARELSSDNYTKFVGDIYKLMNAYISNSTKEEKIPLIQAIDELIDIDYDENENSIKISKFSNFLLRIILSSPDVTQNILILASKTLGHLVRQGGTVTAEVVDRAATRAFECLNQTERNEIRRLAAVYVLKELAMNSPLFNVHIPAFIENIWEAIRDPSQIVREVAVEALRASLDVIATRDVTSRNFWYNKLWESSRNGFERSKEGNMTHGSLMVIGELLVNTGGFMEDHFKDTADLLFKYKDTKNVKKTILTNLPRLAALDPKKFSKDYLNSSLTYLLNSIKTSKEDRGRCFIAIGEIGVAVKGNIKPFFDQIIPAIKNGLVSKKKVDFCSEALTCLAYLAEAIGHTLRTYIQDLMPEFLNGGLSEPIISALEKLGRYIPIIMPDIQELLLNYLSAVLGFKSIGENTRRGSIRGNRHSGSVSETGKPLIIEETENVALALTTLGSFNFVTNTNVKNFEWYLDELARDCVVKYLDIPQAAIRREAARTAAKLVRAPKLDASLNQFGLSARKEILDRLLILGISDPDPSVRIAVIASLDTKFDEDLALAENLRYLFLVLNDEIFEVRELAITVIGRLTLRNPAYVMPSLRKTLIQLLKDLQYSSDSKSKEESARLLSHLIQSSKQFIKPYVDTIIQILEPNLKGNTPYVISCVLSALGELSLAGGAEVKNFVRTLIPLLLSTLVDHSQSSAAKREIAIRTLGKFSSNTGYVVSPYFDYPKLMEILINGIKTENNKSTRKEILKVLGILGALDPYSYEMIQLPLSRLKGATGKTQKVLEVSDSPTVVPESSKEDYYPRVALSAFVTILKDPALSVHYQEAINSLLPILKSLSVNSKLKLKPFMDLIMPPFFQIIRRTNDSQFQQWLFQELSVIVSIVKVHIRDYLPEIFEIIGTDWTSNAISRISLIRDISKQVREDFKVYLPSVMPSLLRILYSENKEKRPATREVLISFEAFGSMLEEYLHLVVPAIVNLIDFSTSILETDFEIYKLSLQTLSNLCKQINLSDYASRIVLAMVKLLNIPTPDSKKEAAKFTIVSQLHKETLYTFWTLVLQLGADYAGFVGMVNDALVKLHIYEHEVETRQALTRYETLISRLLKNQPLITEEEKKKQDLFGNASVPFDRKTSIIDLTNQQALASVNKMKVPVSSLKTAWEVSQRTTKEDWAEWMRVFSMRLLKDSPYPAIRSCSKLAQDYYPLVRDVFNAAFISCWQELDEINRRELAQSLTQAITAENIPPDILQTLLNLAEFMEHEEVPINWELNAKGPSSKALLAQKAEYSQAFAKALYYHEELFQTQPTNIEALISLNNRLGQPEAAYGVLRFAQENYKIELKEDWYEKLHRWENALAIYEKRFKESKNSKEVEGQKYLKDLEGQMNCLHSLGRWEELEKLAATEWEANADDLHIQRIISKYAVPAAWIIGNWERMEKYLEILVDSVPQEGAFYKAILLIHNGDFEEAQKRIDFARERIDSSLTSLLGESYSRAYDAIVRVQQLSELEEVIQYKVSHGNPERLQLIRSIWENRLMGCSRNVDTWQKILPIHSLVLKPTEDMRSWIKFSRLCRRNNRPHLGKQILLNLLGTNQDPLAEPDILLQSKYPSVSFAFIKHSYEADVSLRSKAISLLEKFATNIRDDPLLQARAYYKLGKWKFTENLTEEAIPIVLNQLHKSITQDPQLYKAWHSWAIVNFEAISYYEKNNPSLSIISQYLVPAISGFFRSIALSPQENLQDTLRLLTLWFKYGYQKDVETALVDGFTTVSIDIWLQVIPQILARIAAPTIRNLLQTLLKDVAKEHPQALVFPLTVALKSQAPERVAAAKSVLNNMRKHSARLVDQALLVSEELVRVAILWNEIWHEGLEEASRLHFAEHNPQGAIERLKPLHDMMKRGPETMAEAAFLRAAGRDVEEALEWSNRYQKTKNPADINQAWDLYYQVFRLTKASLTNFDSLHLEFVSPKLLTVKEQDFELAVPGTYLVGEPTIRLVSFVPTIEVFSSKQRPRKLIILGSDGAEYVFLLKGHEDLRQDERVMQVFGLVNTLLGSESETARNKLNIQRYSVVALSPYSGLLGWVPHCDTFHSLIRAYRDARKIPITHEHRYLLQMSSDYINLTSIQKIEIFKSCLEATKEQGYDLKRILWLQSKTAETWFANRTNYTRSVAVMSMVGYILGLGDRHCSNLMLDRETGKVIHIDFGDCFEVAMHRDKFPERVPFRLTRMIVNAMGVSGIEGTFRHTCESVMKVLRANKESLMAVLEAFVYDPLISWRLLNTEQKDGEAKVADKAAVSIDEDSFADGTINFQKFLSVEKEEIPEVLDEKALTIVNRISNKLSGKDFAPNERLDVPQQVQRLIKEATDIENLSQCYLGWSPYW